MSNLYLEDGPKKKSRPKVMLATPSYDNPDASYTFSIALSREALTEAGIDSAYLLLVGNAHVDDSRNAIAYEFMKSDCDALVFLDADVSWKPSDIVSLCLHDVDLVGGVYPFRRDGADHMPVRYKEGHLDPVDGLLEVEGLPTGFLKISRKVFDALIPAAEVYRKNGEDYPILFERDILNGGRRGGDIHFCMNAMDAGFQPYAAVDLHLGHTGKHTIKDSLAAVLRRQKGETLKWIVDRIWSGEEKPEDYAEAFKAIGNDWGASDEILMIAVAAARKADGPIIETGSGLSTVLMAAATDQEVYAIEHEPYYADRLRAMVQYCGLKNVTIIHCQIKGDWYDLAEVLPELPEKFALGLNDGPPRQLGDRMRFFDILGGRVSFILSDDADDPLYADKLREWADANGKDIVFPERRSAVIRDMP